MLVPLTLPVDRTGHPRRLIWLVAHGAAIFGLADLFSESVVLCLNDGPELDAVPGARFVTHEALTGRRRARTASAQSALDHLWSVVQPTLAGRAWHVVTSGSGETMRAWAASTASVVHAPGARLHTHLNDKRALFALLDQLGLPRLPGEWAAAGRPSYEHWRRRFGERLVVQLASSTGGLGTAMVDNDGQWVQASGRFDGHEVWIAPYAGPVSLNVNAIAQPGGSVAAHPSIQITGVDFMGCPRGTYGGNDYTAAAGLPRELLADVRLQTVRLGDALAQLGYCGLFGLDFVVSSDDGRARAVDLNPRWQGSTPLLAQAQLRAGRPCLPAAALLLAVNALTPAEATRAADGYYEPVAAAQARILVQPPGGQALPQPWQPGVYSRERHPSWIRPGRVLGDLSGGDLLMTGFPRPGTVLERTCSLCSVAAIDAMLEPGTSAPLVWLKDVCEAVTRAQLPPVGGEMTRCAIDF